VYLLLDVSW